MPFKSEAQRRFLFAKKPKLAHKWADKYGTPENLPDKLAKRKMRREK